MPAKFLRFKSWVVLLTFSLNCIHPLTLWAGDPQQVVVPVVPVVPVRTITPVNPVTVVTPIVPVRTVVPVTVLPSLPNSIAPTSPLSSVTPISPVSPSNPSTPVATQPPVTSQPPVTPPTPPTNTNPVNTTPATSARAAEAWQDVLNRMEMNPRSAMVRFLRIGADGIRQDNMGMFLSGLLGFGQRTGQGVALAFVRGVLVLFKGGTSPFLRVRQALASFFDSQKAVMFLHIKPDGSRVSQEEIANSVKGKIEYAVSGTPSQYTVYGYDGYGTRGKISDAQKEQILYKALVQARQSSQRAGTGEPAQTAGEFAAAAESNP